MTKAPHYYQLRHAIRAVRKVSRGKRSGALRVLNEMRVRAYSRYFNCGLGEFGLAKDPVAQSLIGRVQA